MVAKANTGLELMNYNDPDKPQTVKFMAAQQIQNNHILYQLNSASTTEWIRKLATHKAFLMTYSSSAKICNKLYHIITKFVPTTFTMDDDYSHSKRFDSLWCQVLSWVMAVCAITDDPKMVKTQFAPKRIRHQAHYEFGELLKVGLMWYNCSFADVPGLWVVL